jgi:hypothetical protein
MANPDPVIAAMRHPFRKAGDNINQRLNHRKDGRGDPAILANPLDDCGPFPACRSTIPDNGGFQLVSCRIEASEVGLQALNECVRQQALRGWHTLAPGFFAGHAPCRRGLNKKIEGFPL